MAVNEGFSLGVANSVFEHQTSLQTTSIVEKSRWDEPVQVSAAVDKETNSDEMQKRKRVKSIDLVHTDWSSEDSDLYDSLCLT